MDLQVFGNIPSFLPVFYNKRLSKSMRASFNESAAATTVPVLMIAIIHPAKSRNIFGRLFHWPRKIINLSIIFFSSRTFPGQSAA